MTDDPRRAAAKSAWERSAWDQGVGLTTIDGIIAVYDALRAWDVAHSVGPSISAGPAPTFRKFDPDEFLKAEDEAAAHSKPIPRRVRCTCHEAGSPDGLVGILGPNESGDLAVSVAGVAAWHWPTGWIDVDSDPIATAPAPIKITDEMVDRATLAYMQDARLSAPWWAMRAALIAALSPDPT